MNTNTIVVMGNIIATGEPVEIVAVKGGWTTVRTRESVTSKVRNSAVERNSLLSFADQAVLEAKCAATQVTQTEVGVCPKCGSIDLYCGHIKSIGSGMGIVVDEEYVTGCRHCDWVHDSRTTRMPGMRYVKNAAYRPEDYRRCVSAHGHASYDCGDRVAKMLEGKELDEVYEMAADLLDLPLQTLAQKYGHLNPGMQRMNLGNRLRTHFNKANGE